MCVLRVGELPACGVEGRHEEESEAIAALEGVGFVEGKRGWFDRDLRESLWDDSEVVHFVPCGLDPAEIVSWG